MKSGLLALCTAAFLSSANAVSCKDNSPPPTMPDTFGLCVWKNSSTTKDTIVDLPQNQCVTQGNTVRQWVKVGVKRDDDKPFNPTTPHAVDKIIVTLHGTGGFPGSVYFPIRNVMTDVEKQRTWVVSPQFLERGELPVSEGVLVWECSKDDAPLGRELGDATILPAGIQVSSFDLLDHLIKKMKQWSTATEIVVVGFSAGGKMLQRYSMATTVEDTVGPVRYIISSFALHAYLTSTRYGPPPTYTTIAPPTPSGCTTYDNWPSGLADLPKANHYMNFTSTALKTNVQDKPLLYLIGSSDTDVGNTSCGATWQGANRYERALIHWKYLKDVGAAINAHFCVVGGAGHDASAVLKSPAAQKYWRDGNVTQICDCQSAAGPIPC